MTSPPNLQLHDATAHDWQAWGHRVCRAQTSSLPLWGWRGERSAAKAETLASLAMLGRALLRDLAAGQRTAGATLAR